MSIPNRPAPFVLRRMQLENSKSAHGNTEAKRQTVTIESIGHVAQIALAVVAIFGYFYTVRPIYQKDRLEEQVAEFDGQIRTQKRRLLELESSVSRLESERAEVVADLARERNRKNVELEIVEKQLEVVRNEKSRIEDQTRFMTFRYRLPDGSPALNQQQVRIAQDHQAENSLRSRISLCNLRIDDPIFSRYGYIEPEKRTSVYPFTEKEFAAWKEFGKGYPLKAATACIEAAAARSTQETASAELVERVRQDSLKQAQFAALRPWNPPFDPDTLVKELQDSTQKIAEEMQSDLEKNELEYGKWESVVGASRREIYRHNYTVGKQNARNTALNKRYKIEFEQSTKADAIRKSINDETERLLTRPSAKN